ERHESQSAFYFGRARATGYTRPPPRETLFIERDADEDATAPEQPDTTYYYTCGLNTSTEYTLKTPPAQFAIKFAVSGDLGQTTLQHIRNSSYEVMLLPGDLSCADFWQPRWDSFGRLVSPYLSRRPWMVTTGNHDVESVPIFNIPTPFKAYNARWHMPFEQSGSTSNEYYSFNVAGVHVIMLGSYTDFDQNSAQYKWLQGDLQAIDRTKTPWVFLLPHAPWYNSNLAHQGKSQSVDMKADMEELLNNSQVDVVFAGHVHAYECFTRVYNGQANNCAPMYISIGDGGNREGLASKYMDPQPATSLFRRQASAMESSKFSTERAPSGHGTGTKMTNLSS
ncbi:putative purple acid phosphatase 20, partial [Drosera capensis]